MNKMVNTNGRVAQIGPRREVTVALRRAETAKQQQLENYQILRTLALSGELEAFSATYALDFERTPEAFDETVACWGKIWLQRKGAL